MAGRRQTEALEVRARSELDFLRGLEPARNVSLIFMSDPRNVAHDKKVTQEKEHTAKPGKKTRAAKNQHPEEAQTSASAGEVAKAPPDHADLEKSLTVLSKLKEMEFHSRANIEKLAELTLTIEDELKQKAFAEPIGALYSAQDAFQSKISALIESYEAECERLKPA